MKIVGDGTEREAVMVGEGIGYNAIMEDGTAYFAPYGVIGLDPKGTSIAGSFDPCDCSGTRIDDSIPLGHRVEIAEYMMRAWDEYRSRLSYEMIGDYPFDEPMCAADNGERDRPVTRDMIMAGMTAWERLDPSSYPSALIVEQIYRAMALGRAT